MRRLVLLLPALFSLLHAAPDGPGLYQKNCAMCHGPEGLGLAGVFPPLAKSDFLVKKRELALRGPMEGLTGPITVNGQAYRGGMPPALLDDGQLTAVFNHILTSWGNQLPLVSTEEIARVRATTRFPTFEALKASTVSETLPTAPAGWALTLVAELDFSPTRLLAHPDGIHVLVLSPEGDIRLWNPGHSVSSTLDTLIRGNDYIGGSPGDSAVMGIATDQLRRLYITCNQLDKSKTPILNRITVFRTGTWSKEQSWDTPKPWFTTSYPYGIGPYNHGLSHIALGPDGLLYLTNGARTDSGEPGAQPGYSTVGEIPETSALWRLDPAAAKPVLEIFAKGLRNTYGFCWDSENHLIGTDNGPDAHTPEELNLIEKGHHYGFPYQYSDLSTKPYPHTPDIPDGLEITRPFRNLGPDGGGKGIATFEAHSCPTGIVWLENDWPAPLGGSFLTTRYGNLIQLDRDVGYDVLQLRPDFPARTITSNRLLHPLGRPVDLLKLPGHRLIIAENSRGTTLAAGFGTPGRLLLLQPK